jgi:hypothetical protein
MPDGRFIFGPFVTRSEHSSSIDEHVENTGCVLEFSTSTDAHCLQILACSQYSFQQRDFQDYAIRESQLPFGIECYPSEVKQLLGGPYITLSAFLAELYKLFEGATPIQRLLQGLAEVGMPVTTCLPQLEKTASYRLRSEIEDHGYRVGSVSSYGRRILVDFVWTASTNDENTTVAGLVTGGVDFRPRPNRTLGPGRWVDARKHSVEELLFAQLQSLSTGAPTELFTNQTKTRMLAEFNWTPLALMTNEQARHARIEFIRANSSLTKDTKHLAQAMKDAKLYSEETSLSQICKFLPSLQRAAQFRGQ